MRRRLTSFGCLLLFGIGMSAPAADADKSWPTWRGPDGTGVAPYGNPPLKWDENTNIQWKIPIPGRGYATPIVWGKTVYVVTAVPTGKSDPAAKADEPKDGAANWMSAKVPDQIYAFTLLALDLDSGKVVWEKVLHEGVPHETTHGDGTWASNSSVTDGEHLYAYFGSNGLFCLDMKGNVLWQKDLGNMRTRRGFGEGSSPALYQDTLVLNWDHEDDSFIVALNKKTGDEIWRSERDEPTSWSTPLIVPGKDGVQVIVSASNKTRGYDLKTGKVIWELGGLTLNVIPTPVYQDGIVYVMSGFRGNKIQAIKLDEAKGDIEGGAAVLWSLDRDAPYVPSPLLYEGLLYYVKTNTGVISCIDAKSGEKRYGPQRLDGIRGIYASPVAAKGRIYFAGRGGGVTVLKAGGTYEVMAQNSLDEGINASPIIVGDRILIRGENHLYCIAEKAAP